LSLLNILSKRKIIFTDYQYRISNQYQMSISDIKYLLIFTKQKDFNGKKIRKLLKLNKRNPNNLKLKIIINRFSCWQITFPKLWAIKKSLNSKSKKSLNQNSMMKFLISLNSKRIWLLMSSITPNKHCKLNLKEWMHPFPTHWEE